MGEGSCVAFPPGAVHGQRCISIGSEVLVAPFVTMAVGIPGEDLGRHTEAVIDIGDRSVIGRGSCIVARSRVEIGEDVTTGPYVYITDHNHGYSDVTLPISRQWPVDATVRIGAGSWLGTGVVVLPGADIGRNVTVAAGSVVRGKVPDYSVVAGSPARTVRRYLEGRGWVPAIEEPGAPGPEEGVQSAPEGDAAG